MNPDARIRKQLASPRKIYVVDPAFAHFTGNSISPNTGRNLENLVYIELRRRKQEVYSYSKDRECDFIIREGTRISTAIQVCDELNDLSEEREIKGLIAAMNEFDLDHGTIITGGQDDERTIEGRTIRIIPAWRWLLEEPVFP